MIQIMGSLNHDKRKTYGDRKGGGLVTSFSLLQCKLLLGSKGGMAMKKECVKGTDS